MTTLRDRPKTALIVIDVQKGVMAAAHNRDGVIANIKSLVDRARAESVPVLWVQHNDKGLPRDTESWEYVSELERGSGEPLIHKSYGDSFEATDLEEQLAQRGIGRLIVTGAQTDMCIRSTIHGAFARGYDVTLVGDAHTTEDLTVWGAPPPDKVIAHTNMYWSEQSAPGRQAGTVETAEVRFKEPQPVK
jgi:nicotinamidase-related amidase